MKQLGYGHRQAQQGGKPEKFPAGQVSSFVIRPKAAYEGVWLAFALHGLI
jgi:hypothetical protein